MRASLLLAPIAVEGVVFKGSNIFQYDYSHHGADWAQGMCSSSERQSPVDLPTGVAPSGKLTFHYMPVSETFDVLNNGHTVSADFNGFGVGGISYENGWYNLMNVNFHSPSEHTWGGKRFPLEAHLIHKNSISEALLIVAVPFDNPNIALDGAAAAAAGGSAAAGSGTAAAFLQANSTKKAAALLKPFLGDGAIPDVGKTSVSVLDGPVDFGEFLGEGKTFVEYAGSLTAPPCAEIVTWMAAADPVAGADAEVEVFFNAIMKLSNGNGNYRAAKQLNGRPVAGRVAVKDEPPVVAPPAIAVGPSVAKDREMQAMMWAKKAMDAAKEAKEYVASLDERLRKASQARADALAGGASAEGAAAGVAMTNDDGPVEASREAAAKAIGAAAEPAVAEASSDVSAVATPV